jgi:hypothetical protein
MSSAGAEAVPEALMLLNIWDLGVATSDTVAPITEFLENLSLDPFGGPCECSAWRPIEVEVSDRCRNSGVFWVTFHTVRVRT